MKKRTKSLLINFGLFLGLIIIIFISLYHKPVVEKTDDEILKCIASKTTLYVQLGCSHCELQKEILGEGYNYFNKIDCFYEPDKCQYIFATPTWKINQKSLPGIKSIEELRELTKC